MEKTILALKNDYKVFIYEDFRDLGIIKIKKETNTFMNTIIESLGLEGVFPSQAIIRLFDT